MCPEYSVTYLAGRTQGLGGRQPSKPFVRQGFAKGHCPQSENGLRRADGNAHDVHRAAIVGGHGFGALASP